MSIRRKRCDLLEAQQENQADDRPQTDYRRGNAQSDIKATDGFPDRRRRSAWHSRRASRAGDSRSSCGRRARSSCRGGRHERSTARSGRRTRRRRRRGRSGGGCDGARSCARSSRATGRQRRKLNGGRGARLRRKTDADGFLLGLNFGGFCRPWRYRTARCNGIVVCHIRYLMERS